jgi:hypothetical protein
MKTRAGFVSNSSSSSFVLLGIKTKDITSAMWNLIEENYNTKWTACNEDGYFGLELSHWSDDEYCQNILPLDKLSEYVTEVKKTFEQLGITEEPQLISGIRMS